MPRLCTNCGETKSKSLFVKGRILCKQCEEVPKRAPQEVDVLQVLTTEDLLGTLQELSTKMEDVQKKLAEMDDSRMMQDVLTTLDNMHEVLQDVPKRMDELQKTLDALQDVPRKLEELQSMQKRLETLEDLFAHGDKSPSVTESIEEESDDEERIPLRCTIG